MNALILFLSMLFFLVCVILVFKFFGKTGIFVYIGFATILANIMASLSVEVFTLTTTAGSVLYASTFLSTDILSERYGKKAAGQAVLLGVVVNLLWLIGTQIALWFTPSVSDTIYEALKGVFGVVPRMTLASLAGYVCSQSLDVFLYHFWWKKTGNSKKGLWLRNNGSTLISQLVDTTIFVFIAFTGKVPTTILFQIFGTTYLFKAIFALCDTPFAYLARKIKIIDKEEQALCQIKQQKD